MVRQKADHEEKCLIFSLIGKHSKRQGCKWTVTEWTCNLISDFLYSPYSTLGPMIYFLSSQSIMKMSHPIMLDNKQHFSKTCQCLFFLDNLVLCGEERTFLLNSLHLEDTLSPNCSLMPQRRQPKWSLEHMSVPPCVSSFSYNIMSGLVHCKLRIHEPHTISSRF